MMPSFNDLTNLVCERHIKVSSEIAARILANFEHPMHEEISKARLYSERLDTTCNNRALQYSEWRCVRN